VVVAWTGQSSGVDIGLLVMTASQTTAVLPWRGAMAWILVQTVASLVPNVGRAPWVWIAVAAGVKIGFQMFAVGVMQLALREAAAREELARRNEELRAAQALQEQNARLAERLRIARDLHDSLGHHLTALGLNLEVASHVVEGRAAAHVQTARDLSKLLLAEVRDVVSALRDEAGLDVEAALREMVQGIATPKIHLTLPPGLGETLRTPERTHAVFRCVQEIVTNALRHAAADNLWIEITRTAGGLHIRARDDGRGASEWTSGHGLAGMRERVEQAGGRLDVATAAGSGFTLEAVLPLGGGPA
jgi:signal transduction histidine kinase